MVSQRGVKQTAEFENLNTSVERVVEYSQLKPEYTTDQKPIAEWPKNGSIAFRNVSLCYNDKSVLENINFSIVAKEKIGIVGRTGAGKSSIIQSLFRLAEYEGTIEIDGVDISAIPLKQLRQSIAIIPQQSTIFYGTMRENLDPFDEIDDDAIWLALEQVILKFEFYYFAVEND